MKTQVAIIGAGPAGMAAAMQLQRFDIKALLFEQGEAGSLLKNAWSVENYLGVPAGKAGLDLLQLFRQHLKKSKVNLVKAQVTSLDYDSKLHLFKIKTSAKIYFADRAIVATGTKPKVLPLIKNHQEAIKPYLFYEVFPLLRLRNKTIVIIGAGDAAFDNALNLAKHNKVMICNRSKCSAALPLLTNQALKHKNIAYYQEYALKEVGFGIHKKLNCVFTNKKRRVCVEADYILAAIGRIPQKDFYTDRLKLSEKRLIKSGKLFLAGDVKNSKYRQVAIATGDGIVAAMRISNGIKSPKQC